MVKISKEKIVYFIVIILFTGCANQLPPGGGDVDKIPPEVTEVFPPDGTINYNENYFEIEFSEYVDKRSFKDALFISPFVEGQLEYDWTGTTVTIEFAEGLKKNTTYTITVGSDVIDRNNSNRMLSSFTFSFSTGNQIDKNSIGGRVFSSDREGILIFAYKLGEGADTLLNRKPDYVSQTGSDGTFQLNGLASSNYRIFAVKDEYRDLIYNMDQDWIGIPDTDVQLIGNDTSFSGLHFKMFKADTTAPRMIKAIMTDDRHILLSLSDDVDKSVLRSQNFYLVDSTINKTFGITFVYKRVNNNSELVLVTNSAPSIDNVIYLFAENLSDTLGNTTYNDYISLTVSDKPDTSYPKLISTLPQKNANSVDFKNAQFTFYFDDAFLKDNIQRNITFTDTLGKGVPFNIDYEDDAAVIIKPLTKLKSDKDYIIKLNLAAFKDVEGNFRDSLYEFRFKTISGLDFTGVDGKMLDINLEDNPVLVLENTKDKKLIYTKKLNDEKFSFNRIVAGKYILWCFLDKDNDLEYDYGWPQPIKFSERFYVYSDTLKLKPRWVITDVIFQFK